MSCTRRCRTRRSTSSATQVAHGVAARNKSPGFLTQRSLRGALYPPDDPSLRMATPESVRALTLDAVRAYYTQRVPARSDHHRRDRQGHSAQQARTTIEKYFGALERERTAAAASTCRRHPPMPRAASRYRMRAACRIAWCSHRTWR